MTTPDPVPTSGPPCAGADVEVIVPGVWAPGASDAAVAWALGQVEDYCGRHFALGSSTVSVTPSGGAALLPDPPVQAVTEVEAFLRPYASMSPPVWVTLDPSSYYCTPDGELCDISTVGHRGDHLGAGPAPFGTLPQSLKVTYEHGFTNWPPAVIAAVKALAAAYLVNPAGMSEQRTAETMRRWLTGGAAAAGATTSGKPAGGITTATALDRYVLVEVG